MSAWADAKAHLVHEPHAWLSESACKALRSITLANMAPR